MNKNRTKDRTTDLVKKIIELRRKGKTFRDVGLEVGKAYSWVNQLYNKHISEQKSSGSAEQLFLFEVHNYHIEFAIIEKPHNWQSDVILQKRRMDFKRVYMNGWENHITRFARCQVHLKENSVTVIPPKIISRISPEDAIALIDELCFDLTPRLEHEFAIKLSGRYVTWINISRREIALLNDKIFDLFQKHGFSCVKDERGRLRLKLDRSNGAKHIETGTSVNAINDMNKLTRFIGEVICGDYSLKDMKEAIVMNQQALIKMKDFDAENNSVIDFNPHDLDYIG